MNEQGATKTGPKGDTTYLLIGIVASILIASLSWTHFYQDQEASIYDFRFQLRNDLFGEPDQLSAIATIDIDDLALQSFGFPFTRDRHAVLVDILHKYQTRMIGFDIFFYEPSKPLLSPEEIAMLEQESFTKSEVIELIKDYDRDFLQSAQKKGIVYLAQTFEVTERGADFAGRNLRERTPDKEVALKALASSSIPMPQEVAHGLYHTIDIEVPLPSFIEASHRIGFALPKPDHDGIVRRYRLVLAYDGRIYFALAFIMACDYLQVPIQNVKLVPGEYAELPDARLPDGTTTDIRIPITDRCEMLVNWTGPFHTTFRHLPYNLILDFSEFDPDNRALKLAKRIVHQHPEILEDPEAFLRLATTEGDADLSRELLMDTRDRVSFYLAAEGVLLENPDLTVASFGAAIGVPEEEGTSFTEVWGGPFNEIKQNLRILNILTETPDLSLEQIGERMGVFQLEKIQLGVGVLRDLIRKKGGVGPEDRPLFFLDRLKSAGLHDDKTIDRIVTADDFKNSVLFYGLTATGTHDLNPTPFGAREAMLGAHVNVFNTILTQNFLRRWPRLFDDPRWGNAVIMLLLGLCIGLLVPRFRALSGATIVLLLLTLYLFGAFLLFAKAGIWVDALGPVATLVIGYLSITLYNYVQKEKEKDLVQGAFGHYLDPTVVNQLVENPDLVNQLGGDQRTMTVYFSDVASFSTISENITPVELVELLNEYLTEMCDIIAQHNGTIDKFEGDAIMAFWGAPVVQEDHANRAVLASVDMQNKLVELRQKWEVEGKMEDLRQIWADQGRGEFFSVRMGINTGEMVVGNMGSHTRVDYTIMGDAVNLASRLEGAGKAYNVTTMISESTYRAVREAIEVRELDSIRVVGKDESVRVYEILGRKGEVDPQQLELVDCYAKGLAMYKERKWDEAIAFFEAGLKVDAADGPCKIFIERCEDYKQDPPPENWNAVHDLESK